mmetsp:Transcript_14115/g.36550  ORF Transcript_14115/g.36550 Transcript_14115/m.36550 type:complete len:219 (-) Transcript_14115:1384-2040(-)
MAAHRLSHRLRDVLIQRGQRVDEVPAVRAQGLRLHTLAVPFVLVAVYVVLRPQRHQALVLHALSVVRRHARRVATLRLRVGVLQGLAARRAGRVPPRLRLHTRHRGVLLAPEQPSLCTELRIRVPPATRRGEVVLERGHGVAGAEAAGAGAPRAPVLRACGEVDEGPPAVGDPGVYQASLLRVQHFRRGFSRPLLEHLEQAVAPRAAGAADPSQEIQP